MKEKMEFNMTVEEVAEKFGLEIEEVKPDYYKVLNPKRVSLFEFSDCFDRCILVYTDLEDIVNERHWVVDKKGMLYYFTPFFDDEHGKIAYIADEDGLSNYFSTGYDHDYSGNDSIDSIFLEGEMP